VPHVAQMKLIIYREYYFRGAQVAGPLPEDGRSPRGLPRVVSALID